jgi:hypothetical protein
MFCGRLLKKSTREHFDVEHALCTELAARCIALLILFEKGLITTPLQWLIAQIDGFSTYIERICYAIHGRWNLDRLFLNTLLEAVAKAMNMHDRPCMSLP